MKTLTHWKDPVYYVKLVIMALILGYFMHYGAAQNVTFHDIIITIAKTPLLFVIFIEFLDKISDRFNYRTLTNVVTQGLYPDNGKTFNLQRVVYKSLIGLFIFAVAFFVTAYGLAGWLGLSINNYSPAVIIVSALYAWYVLAPDTGDEELILWLWLGAQVATWGHYFIVFPQF